MALLDATRAEPPRGERASRSGAMSSAGPEREPVTAYLQALLCVAAFTAIALAVKPYTIIEDEEMIYLLGILFVSLRFDVKVSLFAAVLGVLSLDFFFIPPRFAFALSDGKRTLTFLAMIVVAGVVSGLNERLRSQERQARRTAKTREALYQLNVDLAAASQSSQLAAAATRHLETLFESPATVVLKTPEGQLEATPLYLGPKEVALKQQAWLRNEFSARPGVDGYAVWVPLAGIHEPLGVIGLKVSAFDEHSEKGLLLSACAHELVTAIERVQLANAVHRSQLEAETERMRSSLLSAVSHDLKTPLANIVAAGSTLLEHRHDLEAETHRELLSAIVGEGERLSRLVQNLLSITRLESPTIELKQTSESVAEIVAAALERLRPQLGGREVRVDLPADLPWVLGEPALIEQVLCNLVENAVRYTPASSPIDVSARATEGAVDIQVADRGPGIPEAEMDRVFEKFYRGSQAPKNDGGVGLGLTICRAIVRAHGGKIAIRARQGGGTLVEFTLSRARAPRAEAADITRGP